ncbi:hypothetical protein V8G54_034431 [Vigna mungo]|uniref:Serine aminopeptidase S33 domain-containing protein n=1 Tax=Vigna mungo TaxID=3915 RepID=A0AAQ3RHA2_VIGMU
MSTVIYLLINFLSLKPFNGAVLVAPMCKISDNIRPKWPIPQILTFLAIFFPTLPIVPMCKISDSVRPRWPIPQILTFLARFFPTLPIVPTPDLLFKSVKVPRKKLMANMNPLRYRGKPKLGTVVELLRVTDFLNQRLSDVKFPFFVLHGSTERITGEGQNAHFLSLSYTVFYWVWLWGFWWLEVEHGCV